MDKNAIKKYAVWARRELISRVSQRAALYEITDKDYGDASADSVLGRVMSAEEKHQRQALIAQIREKGYEQVMEEIAYTWFNRFIALRFMEVNGYLPSRVRVFTDDENNFKPQILTEAIKMELDGLDMEKVYALKNANDDDALFKYMLIVQCNALSSILPGMFQRISDYTELLFPDNLLREGSVIEQMISMIPEEDWKDAVQIIGWLYQYYNSEKKDDVFAALKKNVKITKENIPAATQLFTPDWIVRYMVENSLGRLWVEGHPNDELKSQWKYYMEEAQQEPEVQAQLAEIRKEYAALTPDQLKVIDPCSGSGHILAYMFDVLMQIYESYGYTTREAVASIVENNLYGLDIDDRAAQLAYFAVMMKARQYDRRFFSRGIQPHVYAIAESNHVDSFALEYFCNGDAMLKKAMDTIISELHDAKEYGSILTVTPQDWSALYARFVEIEEDIHISREAARRGLLPLVQTAEALAQKYDTVVTNPPYMGSAGMNSKLYDFVKEEYPDVKSDISTVCMRKTISMCNEHGYMSMINIPVWMFISSYEKLRAEIITRNSLVQMLHLGRGVFGSDFGTTAFVIGKRFVPNYCGTYRKLFMKQGAVDSVETKELWFHEGKGAFSAKQSSYLRIPGNPIAYWVSERFISNFAGRLVQDTHFSGGRNKTHGNEQYTRMWWEIADREKWQLYVKGGDFRRWYGNQDVVVDWSTGAKESYASHGGLYNQDYANKPGICWTLITSAKTAFRYKVPEAHYDSGAPTIFNDKFSLDLTLLGFLNSNIATEYLQLLNPTINMGNTYVLSLPYIDVGARKAEIDTLVKKNIDAAKEDWDSFENSMQFSSHPLVRFIETDGKIETAYNLWSMHAACAFNEMKQAENRLNELYAEVYGLSDEISTEVPDRDISIRQGDLHRDIKSLISYAVGCMFGRYSLDVDGLAYAGGEWDTGKYTSFAADKDNIIPICDDEYFEDDIVGLFVKFVKTVYGADTLDENLKFIADALGGKGQPKDVIRNYFLSDFYSDHCKIYQKRPIYWLFDSGKKNGFKALIYMHRYKPDIIARMRTDYVHEQQGRYRTAIADLESRIANADTGSRVKLTKQLTKLQNQAEELRVYEEKIHHLADQMIRIDLDDGVKHNYAIFQDVLAKIK